MTANHRKVGKPNRYGAILAGQNQLYGDGHVRWCNDLDRAKIDHRDPLIPLVQTQDGRFGGASYVSLQ